MMVKSCCLCKTSGNESEKSYFRIPKALSHRNKMVADLALERRIKWCETLNISLNSADKRVCSDHFTSGKPAKLLDKLNPDWLPSIGLHLAGIIKKQKENVTKRIVIKKRECKPMRRKNKFNTVTCRLCAQIVLKTACTYIWEAENLVADINFVTSIQISVDDKLPSTVCKPCIRKVKICCDWMKQFQTATAYLQENYKEVTTSKPSSMLDNNTDYNSPTDTQLLTLSQNDLTPEPISTADVTLPHLDLSSDSGSEADDWEVVTGSATLRKYIPGGRCTLKPGEAKSLKCNNCFRHFDQVVDLKEHKLDCRIYACRLCKPQMTFTTCKDLSEHKATCHKDPMMCHVCGKTYAQSYLDTHFRNHFASPVRCPVPGCAKVFRNDVLFKAHADKMHVEMARHSRLCHVCGLVVNDLTKHYQLYHENQTRNDSQYQLYQENQTQNDSQYQLYQENQTQNDS